MKKLTLISVLLALSVSCTNTTTPTTPTTPEPTTPTVPAPVLNTDWEKVVYEASQTKWAEHVKTARVSQWILESGRGTSELSKTALNFGGLKWRTELTACGAKPLLIKVPSEPTAVEFAKFETPKMFVECVEVFMNRSPYANTWQKSTTASGYLDSIAGIYAADKTYFTKTKSLIPEAEGLLKKYVVTNPTTPTEPTKPEPTTGSCAVEQAMTGTFTIDDHFATTEDKKFKNGSGFPSTDVDNIQLHLSNSCFEVKKIQKNIDCSGLYGSKVWGAGGKATGGKPTVRNEIFNMSLDSAPGKKMLVTYKGKSIVTIVGNYGPRGLQSEAFFFLAAGKNDSLTYGILKDQSLAAGPVTCQ